jgi:3-carboxy-cis,cis-muconate cycloisomerase
MSLMDALFGSGAVTKAFSDEACLQRMLDFEAALARAAARVAVIPEGAARAIAAECYASKFDFAEIARASADAGNLAIPLVAQLTSLVKASDPEAARYVHWGATSQDVIDTGLMLQVRDALAPMMDSIDRLCELLAGLADRHRATPMVARTWLQHAVPTVFGFKVAGWLDAMHRHRMRFEAVRTHGLTLQFGGAAGTLASLGDRGLAVAKALAGELQLDLPDLPWHAHRDRVAEIGTTLALCMGTLGKIARDIALQSQTEVGELAEPAKIGRGGSSTMPHKRNPVNTAVVLAAADRVPGLTATLLRAMQQEHERGLGSWQAEWETLPEIFRLVGGALERTVMVMDGLEVHADRMLENLQLTRGLVFAEAASIALASRVGKADAHKIVEAASRSAIAKKKPLSEVLSEDPQVTAQLSPEDLERIFDPRSYRGEAERFIDRVLSTHRTIFKVTATHQV